MYTIRIEMESERSAKYAKEQIEKHMPLLDGKIKITKKPPITTLDKLIKHFNKVCTTCGNKNEYCKCAEKDWNF